MKKFIYDIAKFCTKNKIYELYKYIKTKFNSIIEIDFNENKSYSSKEEDDDEFENEKFDILNKKQKKQKQSQNIVSDKIY